MSAIDSSDGRAGIVSLIEVDGDGLVPRRLALESAERRVDKMLWLRYDHLISPSPGAPRATPPAQVINQCAQRS